MWCGVCSMCQNKGVTYGWQGHQNNAWQADSLGPNTMVVNGTYLSGVNRVRLDRGVVIYVSMAMQGNTNTNMNK